MSEDAIGIDLGQTHTKAACLDATARVTIIPNSRGDHTTPTALYYPGSDEILIGKDAIEQAAVDPAGWVRNFKLKLDSKENLLANGKVITAGDAATDMIGQVKKDAQAATGQEVTQVVATCPANFLDSHKQALLEAYSRNDIEVLRLLAEPTAAALCYAAERQGIDGTVLVFDMGGGTFDVSIVQMQGPQATVLATDGVAQLGGNDFSKCIEDFVMDKAEAQFGHRPSLEDDPLFAYDLACRIELAKISLSTRPETSIVVGYQGSQLVVEATQAWFQEAVQGLIDKSLETVDKAVQGAGLRLDQLNQLVMVGGTCRLPFLRKAVAEHTGLQPKSNVDPEQAIASGAAIACGLELARRGGGNTIPDPGIFYRDVTAHAVGCAVVDNNGKQKRVRQAVIIEQNTPIPCQKKDSFFLEHEDQTGAHIEILQGDAGADRDDCLLIGEIVLENLPTETVRTRRIEVEYMVDANGMVTATATDTVSGQQRTVSVNYRKGIRPKDKPKPV